MKRTFRLALFALAAACQIVPAAAAEIKVIFPSALSPALDTLLPAFEKATGHHVGVAHGGLGVIAARVEKGEAFDLVISSDQQIDAMAKKASVLAAGKSAVASGGIGVGLRKGAAKPALDSLASFKSSLLAARSLTYVDPATGSAVGAHLTTVFERIGVAVELKAKTILAPSAAALFAALNDGRAELGLAQMSEILAEPALDLAGPLPAEIQNRTLFTAAVGAAGRERDAAQSLVKYLASPESVAVFKLRGLDPAAAK